MRKKQYVKFAPDIDYLVQCDVPVVKKYFCRLLHTNDANDCK